MLDRKEIVKMTKTGVRNGKEVVIGYCMIADMAEAVSKVFNS